MSADTAIINVPKRPREGAWPTDSQVVAYSLSTGARTEIATGATLRGGGAVSNGRVVWWDARNSVRTASSPTYGWDDIPYGNSDIYSYDLSTGQESVVCSDSGNQRNPKIDGDYVIWEDFGSAVIDLNIAQLRPCDIKGVDLRTGERFNITTNGLNNTEAEISNGWVVYTAYGLRSYTGQIMGYELATGRTVQLSPKPAVVSQPRIGSNGLAVWGVQGRGTTMNIVGCNVRDRRIINFTTGTGYRGGPSLGNDMLVYQDNSCPGGYQWVGIDFLSGSRFGVATKQGVWVSQYEPVEGGGCALLQSDLETKHRQSEEDAIYTLSVVQPTVIGTYAAPDPYLAAVAQSRHDFPTGASKVVIANGGIWDDTVVGASLAGAGSPLLLNGRDGLRPDVASELTRLAPKRVLVVGGASAVGDVVLEQIASALSTETVIERTGGAGPVDTALAALGSESASARDVASGVGFDGTVVVVPVAGKTLSGMVLPTLRARQIPVVFANKRFSAGDISRLRKAGVKRAIIVGGTRDVSAYAGKQLGWLLGKRNVTRIAGKDVYQTSTRFNEYAIKRLGMSMNGVRIVSATPTTDSLMSGLSGGMTRSLLLLTGTKKLSPDAANELRVRRRSIRRAFYVGRGTRLVSRNVRRQVRDIVR